MIWMFVILGIGLWLAYFLIQLKEEQRLDRLALPLEDRFFASIPLLVWIAAILLSLATWYVIYLLVLGR